MPMGKKYISRSLRDGLGYVEANEGAAMVRRWRPVFGDAGALKMTLTMSGRSENADGECRCNKVAECNAANHCLIRPRALFA